MEPEYCRAQFSCKTMMHYIWGHPEQTKKKSLTEHDVYPAYSFTEIKCSSILIFGRDMSGISVVVEPPDLALIDGIKMLAGSSFYSISYLDHEMLQLFSKFSFVNSTL